MLGELELELGFGSGHCDDAVCRRYDWGRVGEGLYTANTARYTRKTVSREKNVRRRW